MVNPNLLALNPPNIIQKDPGGKLCLIYNQYGLSGRLTTSSLGEEDPEAREPEVRTQRTGVLVRATCHGWPLSIAIVGLPEVPSDVF